MTRIIPDGGRLKERVNKGSDGTAGEKDEDGKEGNHQKHRNQPPFFVLLKKGPEFLDQGCTFRHGNLLLKKSLVIRPIRNLGMIGPVTFVDRALF